MGNVTVAPRRGYHWTREEDNFLRENLATLEHEGVAAALGRTVIGVRSRCDVKGLYTRRYWTDAELKFLKENYPIHGPNYVAEHLDRSRQSVINIANNYGVHVRSRKTARPNPRTKALLGIFADKHKCSTDEILSWRKAHNICLARWGVMRELQSAGYSTTQIGAQLGRDHSSVCMGLKRLAKLEAAQ